MKNKIFILIREDFNRCHYTTTETVVLYCPATTKRFAAKRLKVALDEEDGVVMPEVAPWWFLTEKARGRQEKWRRWITPNHISEEVLFCLRELSETFQL